MLSMNKTKLVRLAAALALMGTASFGAMAEWTLVSEDTEVQMYVDLSTIRKSGNMAKMWVIRNYKSPKTSFSSTYLSTRTRDEYDCSDDRKRQLDGSAHTERMARGAVFGMDSTTKEWTSVVPGSFGALFLKIACSQK